MVKEYRINNLLGVIMRRFRLPWYQATALIVGVLLFFYLLVTYFDGAFASLLKWEFWQYVIIQLIQFSYILIIYPFMWRLRDKAIQAFKPLLTLDDEAFNRLALKVSTPNRRWEWVAVFFGMITSFIIGQPWNLGFGSGELWTSVYIVIYSPIYNGLLCWLIYDTLASTIRHAQMSRQPLKLDILETNLLTPVAHWSLGISLAFVGGISLSLLNQNWENLLDWSNIYTYSMLICVTILIFFLSMWSAHNAISTIKNRELALAQKNLINASREMKERAVNDNLERAEGLSSTISMWETYQRLVKDVPTWPFNAIIIRRLVASILVPSIVYLIKILAGLGLRF